MGISFIAFSRITVKLAFKNNSTILDYGDENVDGYRVERIEEITDGLCEGWYS